MLTVACAGTRTRPCIPRAGSTQLGHNENLAMSSRVRPSPQAVAEVWETRDRRNPLVTPCRFFLHPPIFALFVAPEIGLISIGWPREVRVLRLEYPWRVPVVGETTPVRAR
jgi:hypothetical protein